jgi:DNA-binding transcriptional ArsR family regulator
VADRSRAPRQAHPPGGKGTLPAAKRAPSRIPDLDRLIHERIRLGIVSALAANESLSFAELKRLLETTDGNLSVHARKLEEAGYVACVKRFEARIPRTEFRITRAGREALERYLTHLDALVRWARKGP